MRVMLRSYWLPKTGNSVEEYEDAFFPVVDGEHSGSRFQCAVADGASESMLSAPWAQILTRTFCRQVNPAFDTLLERANAWWDEWQSRYLQRRERENRPLQWYEEPGFDNGAFSTLLGLTLGEDDPAGTWEGLALGDSCLFQVRGDRLAAAFPLTQSSEFDSRPLLIASNPAKNTGVPERVRRMKGDWQSGDRFFLMTDALAAWFLRECEAQRTPWASLDQAQQNFDTWIRTLRDEKTLRNDDVTLIIIEIS